MRISKYLVALFLSGVSFGMYADNSYAGGVFIMNEEQSGNTANGSMNFFKPEGDGVWNYRVFRQANPGREIPGAVCHARFYGDKLYVVSNHPKTPGSYEAAGTLTVIDAESLIWLDAIEIVDRNQKTLQGRAVCPVSDTELYLSTTEGILRYTISSDNKLSVADPVAATLPPSNAPELAPFQFPYQYGSMIKVGDKVYAVGQSKLLTVIPISDPSQAEVITAEEINSWHGNSAELQPEWGAGSIVTAADGALWLSLTADMNATGTPAGALLRIDPNESDPYDRYVVVKVSDSVNPPANSWYAWTPDGFHASATENVLYWNGGDTSWFSNSAIYKYDIDKDEFAQVFDFESEELPSDELPWMIYGCSMRTSPVSGEMFVSLFKDYTDYNYVLRRFGADGNVIADYKMEPAMWFPALPVFADVEQPVCKPMEEVLLPVGETSRINLLGFASDPDSPDAEINYYLKNVDSDGKFKAEMDGRMLVISPLDENDRTSHKLDITVESQGKTVDGCVCFKFAAASVDCVGTDLKPAAVSVVGEQLTLHNNSDKSTEAMVFTPEGRLVCKFVATVGESVYSLSDFASGLYIVKMGDTSVKIRLSR